MTTMLEPSTPPPETTKPQKKEPKAPIIKHDIVELPIKAISYDPKARLRPVDPEKIKRIKESIAEFGLFNAVSVTDMDTPGRYLLRAGAHRYEACKELGWSTILATIMKLGNIQGRLVEIDKNLCIAELTTAQRVRFVATRKELYELLHPETKKGAAQSAGMKRAAGKTPDCKVCSEADKQPPSFVADTAAKTGRSERSVALEAERGANIAPDVLDEIEGTPLDKGRVLDDLKKLSHEKQREAVKAMQVANVKRIADKYIPEPAANGAPDASAELTRLLKAWTPVREAWKSARKEAQAQLLEVIAHDCNVTITSKAGACAANGAPEEARADA